MTEPTDDELDELRQANSGRLNFVTFREFRVIARAVLAKWGARQPVEQEPLTDEAVDLLCKVGPVYVLDGKVTRTPTQYRDELKAAQRYGLRQGERAHGIKGGQHGTE